MLFFFTMALMVVISFLHRKLAKSNWGYYLFLAESGTNGGDTQKLERMDVVTTLIVLGACVPFIFISGEPETLTPFYLKIKGSWLQWTVSSRFDYRQLKLLLSANFQPQKENGHWWWFLDAEESLDQSAWGFWIPYRFEWHIPEQLYTYGK